MKQERIKIVFGINDFLIGGIQRQLVEQLYFFDRSKYEIVLITLFEFPTEANLYDELPLDLEVHRLNLSGLADVRGWYALARLLSRIKPRIVVSSLFSSNVLFRVLQPFFGYVAIVSEQNTYVSKSLLSRITDSLLARGTYRIVASSKTVAEFTSRHEWIARDKFSVIHNGVPVQKIQESLRSLPKKDILKVQLGFSASDNLIINVARLTPQKNHELLIRAFAEFTKEHPSHKLLIVGPGALRKELEDLIGSLGMTEHIYLLGVQNPVVPYYAISDFFILTSRIEGFALVGIEAMACGLPVVSTRTAGPDEYVSEGNNGFFIEEATVDSVVTAMEKVLSSNRDLLTQNALRTATAYDIAHGVEEYEALWDTCVRVAE